MWSEEIAQAQELFDLWQLSGSNSFQLVCSGLYTFLIDLESQVSYLWQAECRFRQVDFQSMLSKLNEQLMQNLHLLFMIVGMNQQIVDVGQDIGERVDDNFQEFLKWSGCSN